MSEPLLLRKDGAIKAVSSAPSINKTPVGPNMVPLPYPVIADLSNSVDCIQDVLFNGKPVYVLGQSSQPDCKGDDPGSGKGVKSGTVNGEVKPTAGSPTVKAHGKPVVRQGDTCTMQGGNTVGTYVAQPRPVASPPAGAPEPDSDPPVEAGTEQEEAWLQSPPEVEEQGGASGSAGSNS